MLDDPNGKELPVCIDAGVQCLTEIWPQGNPVLHALNTLRERLDESRLQVAILGQFKRGKSTLINAVLRAPLLPSAVIPATAIPTFISWGSAPRIRVTYLDDKPANDLQPRDIFAIRSELYQWVSEEGNPVNRRRVRRVDLFYPADALRGGIVLIDTPGIGSTLQHNTDAALQVLPECDAALFVLSADPPITEAEIAYLRTIRPHVVRLYFVLNKVDYIDPGEQDAAIRFLRSALTHALEGEQEPVIFPVSARRALEAAASIDASAFAASGLPQIEREILQSLAGSKAGALRASAASKAKVLLEKAAAELGLKRRALELPLDDLEQRAQTLSEALRETERERQVAHDTLQGDRQRAIAGLERQAEALRQDARRSFGTLVQRHVEANAGSVDRAAIQRSLDTALPAFFEAKLAQFAAEFHHSVEAVLQRHEQRADALIASVRVTTANLFDVALPPAEPLESFHLGPAPYWVSQKLVHALIPSPGGMLKRVLPGQMRQRYLRRELEEEIAGLVSQNVEALRWSTLRGLDDTFRSFAARLDARRSEAITATEGSIRQVLERRRHQAGDAAMELQRLRGLEDELQAVISRLTERLEAVSGSWHRDGPPA
jgi:GTP-binding protein EngB required for normal cell division